MATTAIKFAGPLRLPSVHEFAKKNPEVIPPQYVRSDEDPPFMSNSTAIKEIPVIDMQQVLSGDLQKLDSACKEWGFFQLINHGVETALVENLKQQIQEFFNLPEEEKNKFEVEPGDLEGFGQNGFSEKQKLEWADTFSVVTLPTNLRKPHIFDKLPAPFREALEAYSVELKKMAMEIMNQMAKALGMKFEDLTVLFDEGLQSMRMNCYPPCPQPELAIGIRAHSDCIGLSIILQVSDVEGLQVRKDGAWVPVVPLPNAFIVNVGDILEIVTNGTYKSIEHRATVNKDKARLSIATFLSPKFGIELAPAPSLITPETPAKYKTITSMDHYQGCFTPIPGKSYLDSLKI